MNKIYIKGLLKKKKFIRMIVILLLSISLFIFLIAYKNDVDKKIYDEKNIEPLRTIKIANTLNLSDYSEYIESYNCDDGSKCTVIFKTYILKDEFLEKYSDQIEDLEFSLGMQSEYAKLLTILKVSVIIIMVFLIVSIIAFIINYFSYVLKTIKLYHILGFSVFKSLTYLNLFFLAILELYSIIVMTIAKIINTNYIAYADYLFISVIVIGSCLCASIISRLVVRKSLL